MRNLDPTEQMLGVRLMKDDHPHNDAEPRHLPEVDPEWVERVCRELDTSHDDDIEEIRAHCAYIQSMRECGR